jgi:hypothetical protein
MAEEFMGNEDAPAITGEPVRQLSVMLENRIGSLHSMINLINDSRVHVLGFSVQDSFDVTILRLVLSDPDTVETIFMERGIAFTDNKIVVVQLDSGASSIADCLEALSSSETNVHISYPLLVRPGNYPLLAISVDDPDFASFALQNQGFKLLFQNDLSR